MQCSLSFPLDLSQGNFTVYSLYAEVCVGPGPLFLTHVLSQFHSGLPLFHVAHLSSFSVLSILYFSSIPKPNQPLPPLCNHIKLSLITQSGPALGPGLCLALSTGRPGPHYQLSAPPKVPFCPNPEKSIPQPRPSRLWSGYKGFITCITHLKVTWPEKIEQ